MVKVAMVLIALASVGCKDRGTIVLDLSSLEQCDGTHVAVRLWKNGSCAQCDCNGCECPVQECDFECDPNECPLEEARADGIGFDPPSAGRYAAIYQYYAANPGGPPTVTAVACFDLVVEADGTASGTETPVVPEMCCGMTTAD